MVRYLLIRFIKVKFLVGLKFFRMIINNKVGMSVRLIELMFFILMCLFKGVFFFILKYMILFKSVFMFVLFEVYCVSGFKIKNK